jgi:hypothetical protein
MLFHHDGDGAPDVATSNAGTVSMQLNAADGLGPVTNAGTFNITAPPTMVAGTSIPDSAKTGARFLLPRG